MVLLSTLGLPPRTAPGLGRVPLPKGHPGLKELMWRWLVAPGKPRAVGHWMPASPSSSGRSSVWETAAASTLSPLRQQVSQPHGCDSVAWSPCPPGPSVGAGVRGSLGGLSIDLGMARARGCPEIPSPSLHPGGPDACHSLPLHHLASEFSCAPGGCRAHVTSVEGGRASVAAMSILGGALGASRTEPQAATVSKGDPTLSTEPGPAGGQPTHH